jgi:tetratricopeptide (TPR) repeat protein
VVAESDWDVFRATHRDNFGPTTSSGVSPVQVASLAALGPVAQVPATFAAVGVPGWAAERFVGREDELRRLRDALTTGRRRVAVHGVAGVGKTALAAHYATTYVSEYPQVVWLTATNAVTIEVGLARLAETLEPSLADLPVTALANRGASWLREHGGWLLVLDDVAGPEDIRRLLGVIAPTDGDILITSRQDGPGRQIGAPGLHLDALPPDAAARLLPGHRQARVELGGLPLTLRLAHAYLREVGSDGLWYPELLRGRAGSGDPLAKVRALSLDRLAGVPLAADVLGTLCWFAPDDVPLDVLRPLADETTVRTAVAGLTAFGLVRRTTDEHGGDLLHVHRALWERGRVSGPEQAMELLSRALPTDPLAWQHWPRFRALLPHVDTLFTLTTGAVGTPPMARTLERCAEFLLAHGNPTLAIAYLSRALAICQRLHGNEDVNTLSSRTNLATAYADTGAYAQAIPLLEQNLADSTRVLGRRHPDTLVCRHNLALAYQNAGDPRRAARLLRRTLGSFRRAYGRDHPETLSCATNLACARADAGHLRRAGAMFERILADHERLLGADHPDTLGPRANLATLWLRAGDVARSVVLLERNLALARRTLGPHHPRTLMIARSRDAALDARGRQGGRDQQDGPAGSGWPVETAG